jgi:hypothetical protein
MIDKGKFPSDPVTRRSFLGRGARSLAGLALGSLGALAIPSSSKGQVPVDFFKDWRDSLPREPVDEADLNTFVFSRLKFITRTAVFGQWDARPDGDENLIAFLRQVTNIPVSYKSWEQRVVAIDDFTQLYHHPFLFMTGEGDFRFEPAEQRALREYFLRGGFLFADDCVANGGDFFYQAFIREIRKIFPDNPMRPVANDHDLYHCFFDFPRGAPHCQGQRRPGMGLFIKDKIVSFVTSGDLHCAWVGFWKDAQPAMTQECLKMGVNVIVYALSH